MTQDVFSTARTLTIFEPIWPIVQILSKTLNCVYIYYMYILYRSVEILSQLPDILTHFPLSCPAPHILCIQFSFNLPDIH